MTEYHLDTCILVWKHQLESGTEPPRAKDLIAFTIKYLEELKKLKGEE